MIRTYEMLAYVQCLLMACDRSVPRRIVDRLARIETYLIERYNRD